MKKCPYCHFLDPWPWVHSYLTSCDDLARWTAYSHALPAHQTGSRPPTRCVPADNVDNKSEEFLHTHCEKVVMAFQIDPWRVNDTHRVHISTKSTEARAPSNSPRTTRPTSLMLFETLWWYWPPPSSSWGLWCHSPPPPLVHPHHHH